MYLADELLRRAAFIAENRDHPDDSVRQLADGHLALIGRTLANEPYRKGLDTDPVWKLTGFGPAMDSRLEAYLKGYKRHYLDIYNRAIAEREAWLAAAEARAGHDVTASRNRYYNESLADLVTRVSEKNRILEYDGRLVQQIDPVFQDPQPRHVLDYRAHFFAPVKNFAGITVETYWFNAIVIWLMTLVLYIALYHNALKRGVGPVASLFGIWSKRKFTVR